MASSQSERFEQVFRQFGRVIVTDKRNVCVVCSMAFIARAGARMCSPKRRQKAYRRRVTDSVTDKAVQA